MTNDLDALEAVAKAATQGEWTVIISGLLGDSFLVCEDVPGHLKPICVTEHHGPKAEEDATHIATFSPSRILALTAEIRGLREALEEIASDTFNGPPGIGIFAAAANELTRRQVIARAALAQGER